MTDHGKPTSYSEAGVSISRGDAVAGRIARIRSDALGAIGGFGGSVALDPSAWEKPRLVTTCDGVGTKVILAAQFDRFDTIGIDLVAMCVNDLVACGARPMAFQDYIACGRIDEDRVERIVRGVVKGCEAAGCTLSGGETAEMPDLYESHEVDLAGFCAGFVEEERALPRLDAIQQGDVVLGLASDGIHANGLSLARKVLDLGDTSVVDELVVPTRIYVDETLRLAEAGRIKAAAHITGGGLVANVARVLPPTLRLEPTWEWPCPPIFEMIQHAGKVDVAEMRTVFNMGIGMAVVVNEADVDHVVTTISAAQSPVTEVFRAPDVYRLGRLVA